MDLKKNKYLVFFAIFFVLLLFFLFLKKSKTEKLLTKEDFASDTYTVIEESEGIVENFPELPQYPNAQITQSKFYTEEGGEGYYLELSTNDTILAVIEWYKEELDEDDWNLIYQTEMTEAPDYYQVEYKKPDIQLDVSAVKGEDGITRVIITHHKGMGEYGPAVKYE